MSRFRAFFPACVLLALALPGRAQSPLTVLNVNGDKSGPAVSPMLYGIFFEEINHAGDGGLYAELVRNRSFEDSGESPEGWTPVTGGTAKGKLTLDRALPLTPQSPRSLKIESEAANGGRFGAANTGYWGIALRKGETYNLVLWARREARFAGPITASLESADGKIFAQAALTGLETDWKRFTAALRSNADTPDARLVLSVNAPGTVWLDVVSLFPKATWKNRPNGLRRDLAAKLDAMRPAFVRFPGGCYCEGDNLGNAFRWKNSLGDIKARPGHYNLWGYRSTDGLGFHEYLLLCEDLGAEPLFVINCGMSHTDYVPLDHLGPWVQDALDALEYANGPVSSKWGGERAKRGHPKPFRLRYMEIGNENGWGNTLPAYEARYAVFHDAIKAKYPETHLVANVPIRNRKMDIVDDHYYNNPEWFLQNAGLYDGAKRDGAKIYVGEYAVTSNCGQGNLRAALAESAFMMGLERNSDVVTLASYAPLFVNVHDRKWNPDAIVYDSAASYATPSWYVQTLFAQNRPDTIVPLTLRNGTQERPEVTKGGVGLGTWRTQAEYKALRVTTPQTTLLQADFAPGVSAGRVYKGDWKPENGVLRQTSGAEDVRIVMGSPNWQNYTVQVKARKTGGDEGFLVLFRARDDGNFYWWNLGGWGNSRHAIEKANGGAKTLVGNPISGRIETGRWYDIRIEVVGLHLKCYLDNVLIHDVEEVGTPTFHALAGKRTKTGELLLKVVNAGASPRPTEIRLDNAGEFASEAEMTVLQSGGPDDENSLTEPAKIVPVTRRISGVKKVFTHTFPPHSLTILRLKRP